MPVIVVTGGSGFIGANLVRSLVDDGHDVVVVDDRAPEIGPGHPLEGVAVVDRLGRAAWREVCGTGGRPAGLEAVLHQGACADTTEHDEAYLDDVNVRSSLEQVDACARWGVPLVYASSAAVYGPGPRFDEEPGNEAPLNAYARSKATVDRAVRARLAELPVPVVGLRYFNVYGPGEGHKGPMASVAFQLAGQVAADGEARIFGAGAGAGPGEHARDFVHVDDVVSVVRWALDAGDVRGIYNCGTGRAHTFGELAEAVVGAAGRGTVRHIPFPPELEARYQARTCADLTRLRAAGCEVGFEPPSSGVDRYVRSLLAAGGT